MRYSLDITFSILVLLLVPGIHYAIDYLAFSGTWYLKYEYPLMIIVPIITGVLCISLRAPLYFMSAAFLAFSILITACIFSDVIWPRHGARGIESFLGTVGGLVGAIIALSYIKLSHRTVKPILALGFFSTFIGFLLIHGITCNTVFSCGPY